MRVGAIVAIWVALLWAAAGLPAAAQDADGQGAHSPFLGGFLKESRIVYPLRLGQWEAQGEQRYDDPALGVSVRYAVAGRADRWIDLYFYPAGVLEPGDLEDAMQATVDGVRGTIGRPGYAEEGEFGTDRRFSIVLDEGVARTIDARSVDMFMRRNDRILHSALTLAVHDLYFVKGRYSVDADAMSRDAVRAELEAVTAGLVRESRLTSTGDCWAPVGGWSASGCVGSDPVEADVPESHREIRLEYRLPERRDPALPRNM